jgi:hypothetical protein
MINNKKRSKKREVKAACDIGGKSHVASGAMWFKKSDFSNDLIQAEDKFTDKDKYSISLSIIDKITKEANQVGKVPVLRFGFEKYKKNYAIIEEKNVNSLLESSWLISTVKKSVSINYKDINDYFINEIDINDVGVVILSFSGRRFYIFTWEDFVEHLNELISI